jgi:hypothetical protein
MMRYAVLTVLIGIMSLVGACRTARVPRDSARSSIKTQAQRRAVAGCATCIFDMKGVSGCKLAVKIEGKAYLVSGSAIDDHGDAHASDGLCNAARDAIVEGRIEGDRFVAKHIELLPQEK